ncbi:hypothetical protein F01_190073 [Burkholderia cenocepacia]|nr:hypothetical protein F01_190073 [Burkholderia cenocepacia]
MCARVDVSPPNLTLCAPTRRAEVVAARAPSRAGQSHRQINIFVRPSNSIDRFSRHARIAVFALQ